MAKAFKADLTASTFTHSLKGYYFTSWLGRAVWKKSPANGFTKHPAQVWNRQQFGLAAQMVASPIWLDYIGALNASRGTEQVPRDILMMAAYGGLFTLTLPDGTTTTQANHSYQPPQPMKRKSTMIVASLWDDAYNAGNMTSGYEVGGGTIRFDTKTTVKAINLVCGQYDTWNAVIWLVDLDASLKITNVIGSYDLGLRPAARTPMRFEYSRTFEAGETITVLIQRSDGDDGHSFTIPTTAAQRWLYPAFGTMMVDVPGNIVAVGKTCRNRYNRQVFPIAFEVENA